MIGINCFEARKVLAEDMPRRILRHMLRRLFTVNEISQRPKVSPEHVLNLWPIGREASLIEA